MSLPTVLLVAFVLAASGTHAVAQPSSPPPAEDALPAAVDDPADARLAGAAGDDDPTFGPVVTVERIVIIGANQTSERLVRRAVLVQEGEELPVGDPRFRRSRFRVLSLGYFYEAVLRLERGSAPGRVVLTVEVWERGSFVLDRIHLGRSTRSPLWAGLELGDTNFLGTGTSVSAAFVWAGEGDVTGARRQLAGRLRYGDPSLVGTPLGVSLVVSWEQATELVPTTAGLDQTEADNLTAFDRDRLGVAGGASWDFGWLSLLVDGRGERLDQARPAFGIPVGERWLAAGGLGVEVDTRSDPVLPVTGQHALVHGEAGRVEGADEGFARVDARWRAWMPLRSATHVGSVSVAGAAVFGRPASFDRLWLADVDRLAAPRPLDLTVSTAAPLDLLGQAGDPVQNGELAGVVEFEYRYQLFRRQGLVYGGDLFAAVGLFALHADGRAGTPKGTLIDLTFDVGLRLDTMLGVFELGLANGLGRLPL